MDPPAVLTPCPDLAGFDRYELRGACCCLTCGPQAATIRAWVMRSLDQCQVYWVACGGCGRMVMSLFERTYETLPARFERAWAPPGTDPAEVAAQCRAADAWRGRESREAPSPGARNV